MSNKIILSPISSSFNETLKSETSVNYLHDLFNGIDRLTPYTKSFCYKDVYSIFSEYSKILQKSNFGLQKNVVPNVKNCCLNNSSSEATHVDVKHRVKDHYDIYANYVAGFREPRKFIFTQTPLYQTFYQFWSMIWNEKAIIIASLTIIDGNGCSRYLPINAGECKMVGSFEIKNIGTRHVRNVYDATSLLVSKKGESSTRKLLHLVYYRWPDNGLPTYPTEIINFIADMNYNRTLYRELAVKDGWITDEIDQTPIIVHCIDSVDRSGVLAVLDICQRKLDISFASVAEPVIDIKDTVLRVRAQHSFAVQKPEQYLFIHMSMIEYALRKHYYKLVEGFSFTNYMETEKFY